MAAYMSKLSFIGQNSLEDKIEVGLVNPAHYLKQKLCCLVVLILLSLPTVFILTMYSDGKKKNHPLVLEIKNLPHEHVSNHSGINSCS